MKMPQFQIPITAATHCLHTRVAPLTLLVLLATFASGLWTDSARGQGEGEAEVVVRVTGISGVTEGAELSGDVWIEAQVVGHPSRVELRLSGPRDFVAVRDAQPFSLMTLSDLPESSKARRMFVSAAGLEIEELTGVAHEIATRTPAAWNTHDWPAGSYTLQAVAFDNAGEEASSQEVSFTVTRGQRVGHMVDGERLPTVAFNEAVQTLQLGQMRSIPLRVTGEMPEGGELMVSARRPTGGLWVEAFTHTLSGPPYRIEAERLELLPPGPMVLQVLTRLDGRVKQVTRQEVEIGEPRRTVVAAVDGPISDEAGADADGYGDADAAAADGEVLPTVRFMPGAPRSLVLGEEPGVMELEVLGEMPSYGDMLLEAYSVSERRVVPEFRHVLSGPPWRVDSAKLTELSTGPVQVRAHVRVGGKLRLTVRHDLLVSKIGSPREVPSELGLIETPEELSAAREAVDVAENVVVPDLPAQVVSIAETAQDRPSGSSATEPRVATPQDISFAASSPDVYELGSDTTIPYEISSDLPRRYRLEVSATRGTSGEEITEFRHVLAPRSGAVDNARLDLLPPGPVVLRVALLGADSYQGETYGDSLKLTVAAPAEEAAEEDPVEESPEDQTADHSTPATASTILVEPDPRNPATRPIWRDPAHVVDGWTQYDASKDSRIVYVSSSAGSDSNSGLTPAEPVQSIARGVSMLRNGYPDWLLFKSGDTWETGLGNWELSGRSPTQPMVVATYGGDERAYFNTNGDSFLKHHVHPVNFIAFVSLHARANLRDPDAPEFNGGVDTEAGIRWLGERRTVIFEDILLEFFHTAAIIQNTTGEMEKMNDITFRRCVVLDSYSGGKGHAQGIYAAKMRGLRLEENLIDHNGYYPGMKDAKPTIFNHNIYVSYCEDFAAVGNILSRASSFGIKVRSDHTGGFMGVTITDNLFLANTNNITIGGNRNRETKDYDPLTSQHIVVARNVFTRSGGELSSGPQALGVDLLSVKDCQVDDNLFIDKSFEYNTFSVRASDAKPQVELRIRRNIVHGYVNGGIVNPDRAQTVSGNLVDAPSSVYVDPDRTVDTYCLTLGVPNATTQMLLGECREMSKGNWRAEFTAPAINRYLRNGFDLVPHD